MSPIRMSFAQPHALKIHVLSLASLGTVRMDPTTLYQVKRLCLLLFYVFFESLDPVNEHAWKEDRLQATTSLGFMMMPAVWKIVLEYYSFGKILSS